MKKLALITLFIIGILSISSCRSTSSSCGLADVSTMENVVTIHQKTV
ncbi:hypothetical protein [Polaribacter tangerinus]|nr:hypothetical protein [Polaribacter tangerinus]